MQKAIAKEELFKAAERALVSAVTQVGFLTLFAPCFVPAAVTCLRHELCYLSCKEHNDMRASLAPAVMLAIMRLDWAPVKSHSGRYPCT